ncbi:MAG: hypothetical protein KJ645_08330 [Planctomycetes bacterium]|nr:hypothetical protein [Planctomycetota bacterium]
MLILISIAGFYGQPFEASVLTGTAAWNQAVEEEEPGKGESSDPAKAEIQSDKNELAFSIAFGLPYVVATSVSQSRDMVVEAVFGATTLSGAARYGEIRNTGTLVVKGYDDAVYSPSPNDRLVVKIDGYTHEFVVKEAQGNSTASTATAWLSDPHLLHYIHRMPGLSEAELKVGFDGANFAVEVKGWYKYKGTKFDLNITSTGGSSGTSDYHGQEIKIKYDLKGKIKGGGIEVDVDEQHAMETVSATNLRLLYSQRGSASRFNATLNNVLRVGGKEYKLKNVKVQTDFKTKGGVSSYLISGLEGGVLEDGKPCGQCVLVNGQAVIKTASGPIALVLPVQEIKPAR